VQEDDQVTLITSNGIALRTPVKAISQMSRMTRGVRIVNPDDGDTVAAMARLAAAVMGQAEDDGAKAARPNGAQAEVRVADAVEEMEVVVEAENGNGEIVDAELVALGDTEI
jgi:DNA gyrase subunit A